MSRPVVKVVGMLQTLLSALFTSRATRRMMRAADDLIRGEVWPAGREHLRPQR